MKLNKMELRKEFEKETGRTAMYQGDEIEKQPTKQYFEWLEGIKTKSLSNKINLKEQYKKETRKTPYCRDKEGCFIANSFSYDDRYVKWLENIIIRNAVSGSFYCDDALNSNFKQHCIKKCNFCKKQTPQTP